jgi:hypothetical protein
MGGVQFRVTQVLLCEVGHNRGEKQLPPMSEPAWLFCLTCISSQNCTVYGKFVDQLVGCSQSLLWITPPAQLAQTRVRGARSVITTYPIPLQTLRLEGPGWGVGTSSLAVLAAGAAWWLVRTYVPVRGVYTIAVSWPHGRCHHRRCHRYH